jgi:hypothetical protein
MDTAKKTSGYVDRWGLIGLLLVAWFCSTFFIPSLFAAEAKDKEPEGKVVLRGPAGVRPSKAVFPGQFYNLAMRSRKPVRAFLSDIS